MGRPTLVCGPMIHNEGTKVQNSSAIRAVVGRVMDTLLSIFLHVMKNAFTRKLFHARMVHARSPGHAGGVRMSSDGARRKVNMATNWKLFFSKKI